MTELRASAASSLLPQLTNDDGATAIGSELVDERVKNKRVALYFAAGWCPMCTSFEPALLKFREEAAKSGKPIELIYVSSDRSEESQSSRAASLGMLSIPREETADVKRKYKIWAGSERGELGSDRRSGVPALVVLDNAGKEMSFVAAESQGAKSLETWPMDDEQGIWLA
eukprot:CAMPEP_0183296908 /NCGR_PEP_ID=MMETSP0160_2-20130417/4327_1 /TAXON_ID=2839 ORGANISM="Odontella Sinensis, Strain Grunow 1884" /NCGR_SAMPLE_ID=MMETSP0160_2 /ASSEMBLY_ACC=CAM_ASM_000250 /LENGTH=169 /DNA_ID=CAMNT_0025458613 /DNA_START=127 /DNA_END=636 /DNA_ORIENTATION=+